MQLIKPEPALAPCWLTGAIRPTMYLPLTMLPTTRTSKEGNAVCAPVAWPLSVSANARPVWPTTVTFLPFRPTVDVPTGAENDATVPSGCGVGNRSAHG